MPDVIRAPGCETDPETATAEAIALALMGVGDLPVHALAENAVWDGAHGARTGRAAIGAAVARVAPADRIRVEQVVAHGRAGTVSGPRHPGRANPALLPRDPLHLARPRTGGADREL